MAKHVSHATLWIVVILFIFDWIITFKWHSKWTEHKIYVSDFFNFLHCFTVIFPHKNHIFDIVNGIFFSHGCYNCKTKPTILNNRINFFFFSINQNKSSWTKLAYNNTKRKKKLTNKKMQAIEFKGKKKSKLNQQNLCAFGFRANTSFFFIRS